jgi:Gas vesicle synthesis protein GvpL/GvpF
MHPMTAYYLYAFTTPNAIPAAMRGVAGGSLEVIASGDLGVIAERVDAAVFETDLRDHEGDPQWLANLAVRHDAVINAHLEAGALPLRFGTLLADHAAVLELLGSSASLGARLDALRGQREYTVRVWAAMDRLETRLTDRHETLRSLRAEVQSASSGKRYLLERRYRDALQTALREALPELRTTAGSSLSALVEGLVILDRTPKTQGADLGVLEAAVLLEATRESTLREALGDWLEGLALQAELSGPFAPYSFVQASSEVAS